MTVTDWTMTNTLKRSSLKSLMPPKQSRAIAVSCARCSTKLSAIGQWLTFYERKWDMKHVTCHGLRHTYCSLLLAQNVPIQTVSKYMGHSDSTVTLKVYSHFIPDTQGIAVNALNRLTE
ncbi:MAG TPA: tyrosine-type recombinase/integrase [Candidatus Scatosoma pullicola]|nr:tyrosine-type recombinase/integrase [Candidatus Scatosoma pullicola]